MLFSNVNFCGPALAFILDNTIPGKSTMNVFKRMIPETFVVIDLWLCHMCILMRQKQADGTIDSEDPDQSLVALSGSKVFAKTFLSNYYGNIYSNNVTLQSSTRYECTKEMYLILYITQTLRALQVHQCKVERN